LDDIGFFLLMPLLGGAFTYRGCHYEQSSSAAAPAYYQRAALKPDAKAIHFGRRFGEPRTRRRYLRS
jgi:hypothetical protein